MKRIRVILAATGFVLVAWAPAASAQVNAYTGNPQVLGVEVGRPQTQPAAVRSAGVSDGDADGKLPVTGGDVAQLVAIGTGAIALGAALHFRRRRSSSSESLPA